MIGLWAMKKAQTHLFFHGRTVKLYRDTIEEILDILTKYCKEVVIASEGYEYESLDELESKRGSDLKEIELKGRSPYVYFHASRGSMGRSWVAADGEGAETPYFLICNLLIRHRRTWLRLILNPLVCLLYFAIWLSLLFIFRQPIRSHSLVIPISLLSISFFIILALQANATYLGQYCLITLRRRHEKSTFWLRNKDEIIRQILSNLLAFGLGLLSAYLLFKKGIK